MSDKPDAIVLRTDALLRELEMVRDIPMRIAIEVGRMRISVRELLKLSPGAVIELKKPAGDPFDVCVNGVQIAQGEVLMVEQAASVRILEMPRQMGLGA